MTPRRVDVCVCTFRRIGVHATLRAIAAQTLPPALALRVIVVDNDDAPHAQEAIVKTAASLALPLTYVHAPARNISIARNAALRTAGAPLVAFIDDDEIPPPDWLSRLVAAADETGADVILGQVVARYAKDAPAWMRRANVHSAAPVTVRGTIRTGYTCNVLFRRTAPALLGACFREDLGRSGGEDTEFFARAHRRGATFAAADAPVFEDVPPDRARLSWLVKRRFRSGQSHALVLAQSDAGGLPGAALAASKCTVCALAALATFPVPHRRGTFALRAALHAGVVARLLGVRSLTLYGKDRRAAG